ncbi:MAG: WecB/TagA/CpsF family glycosyltransferase [Nanoarchaeota archaeon]|nr:WecB/TagA/CpsF family glycosyltransferase [Nanoarchaeota archaeon]
MEKIFFVNGRDKEEYLDKIDKTKQMYNFLNSHDIYQFKKEPVFRKAVSFKGINFIDGFVISFFLSLINLKKVSRYRGPIFTKEFFENKVGKNQKMFFIGLNKEDINNLLKKFPYLKKNNLFYYNPTYIKNIIFSKEEVGKMAKIINDKKIDYVWIGVGCPKQNILSYHLFLKTKKSSFFNVGAALDFLLEKKKESRGFIQKIGLEWLYRLLTDFHHSKKKVWRSLIGSFFYLPFVVKLK